MVKSHLRGLSHEDRRKRREEIAQFIAAGHTRKEAMRKFNVSTGQVDRSCIENGVTAPYDATIGRSKNWSFCRVLSHLLMGKSRQEVAAELGVSRQYVYQVIDQAISHGLIRNIEKLAGRKIVI